MKIRLKHLTAIAYAYGGAEAALGAAFNPEHKANLEEALQILNEMVVSFEHSLDQAAKDLEESDA